MGVGRGEVYECTIFLFYFIGFLSFFPGAIVEDISPEEIKSDGILLSIQLYRNHTNLLSRFCFLSLKYLFML